MRKYLTTSLALAAVLLMATSGLALEKTSVQMLDDSRGNDWNAATTVTVAYYNFCQGWIWIWGGWSPGDITGTCFDNCADQSVLLGNWLFTRTAAPSGYGFTGTIGVYNADDNCCPTTPIAAAPWLPGSAWNFFTWNVPVPAQFVVAQTWAAATGFTAVSRLGSDHPAPGPTGVAACGVCYPTTRVTHSFYYGTPGSPLCPGSVLNDGFCDIEWLVDVSLQCEISVEESTWGQIKALYQ